MSDVKRTITPNDPADFTPTREPQIPLRPFRYWCQKVLPLVYDDSLSYYELLCKVVDYLNKTMEDVSNMDTDVTNLLNAYNQLQEYVNNYFSSLDVQEEINTKLDAMAKDGSLTELIRKYVDPLIENQNNKISVLEERMNTFTKLPSGSTSGDAELIDIRVPASGFNYGKAYPTAGDAVRGQVESLKENIKNIKMVNIFDKTDITTGAFLRGSVGADINSTIQRDGSFYANQIWSVKENDIVRCSNPYMGLTVYDINDTLIANFNDEKMTYVIPAGGVKLRYSSTVTSANYLDNAMITINFEMPKNYVPYNLDSFPTYEDSLLFEEINKLKYKKSCVILRFDGTGNEDFIEDRRYSVVHDDYGYNCTISIGYTNNGVVTTPEQFQKLMKNGVDFGIYSNNNPPSLDILSSNSPEAISACEIYVKNATEAVKAIGAYCPVTWLCRQSNSGYALESALKKYGYMLASGIYYGDAVTGIIEDSDKFTLQTTGLYPSTISTAISRLNTAVANGYDIAILTHKFYDTTEEAEQNYGCTESIYRQFLDAVKSYVDAGKAEVLTYSEYISARKNNAVLRTKENQRIANWIFN